MHVRSAADVITAHGRGHVRKITLRLFPAAAAEWAKPREIRRGNFSCLQAVPDNFNTLTPKLLSGGTRATRPTGPPRPGAPGYRKT